MSTEYKVNIPEGRSGDVEVKRVTVDPNSWTCVRAAMSGRPIPAGEYTALYRRGSLWMSDTPAEWRDHSPAVNACRLLGGRVLINGLGIGMVVKAALDNHKVEHVDVVEIDADVINLVGPSYASERCTIHHADAYNIQWPKGTRWSVAWHDIWLGLCTDNLPEMARLHRKYGRRVEWQGSWGRSLLERERRREKRYEREYAW